MKKAHLYFVDYFYLYQLRLQMLQTISLSRCETKNDKIHMFTEHVMKDKYEYTIIFMCIYISIVEKYSLHFTVKIRP